MVLPDADATLQPAIPPGGRADSHSWFGHPAQLARLFTVEAWERFGFYGMRALLVLYLTDHFLFDDRAANGIYGGYSALVYLTPLVGGVLADRYLGAKRSVKFGAVVMAVGYFLLCFGGQPAKPYAVIDGTRYAVTVDADGAHQQYIVDHGARFAIKGQDDGSIRLLAADGHVARTVARGAFRPGAERSSVFTMLMLLGLAAITVGNGFFKPNISTIVGALYDKGDRRRDAGFTIFYMGINLGSLVSQFLCPLLATSVGWWAGFLLAAVGMLLAWVLMRFDGGRLDGYGEPPVTQKDRALPIYLAAIVAVPVVWFLFVNLIDAPPPVPGAGLAGYILALPVMAKVLFFTFLVAVIGIPLWSWRTGTRTEAQMMMAAVVLVIFNVAFWTLFEQAGSSLTLFADRNTDLRMIGSYALSAGQTQVFNPVFIVLLAPLFGLLWNGMARRGIEPGIPVKFGIALLAVGAGFFVLVFAGRFAAQDYRVSIWWLALLYFVHSAAELCISPVGLSMITKLSMVRVVGMMMGVWFLSISVAQYFAGLIAQVASVETVGGQVTNPRMALETYLHVFSMIGAAAMVAGVLLLALTPVLRRWMHGVS